MYRLFIVSLFSLIGLLIPNSAEAYICPPPPMLKAIDSSDSKSGSKGAQGPKAELLKAQCGGGGTSTPVPGTPGSMSVPSTDNNGAFTITWGASSNIQKAGYYILYQSKNGGVWTTLTSPAYNSTSQAVSGLGDGSYAFKIKACNVDLQIGNEKCSGFRTSSTMTVRNVPSTPSKPSDINTTNTAYTVSWSKPSGSVTYYDVQEKVGSGGWATISSGQSGTSIYRSGKANNTAYYYRVRACNQYSWSCSSYSSQNTVRVEQKPSTPSTLGSINSTSTSYTISWSKPSGTVNFYQIQERVAGGSWSTISSNHTSTSISRSGRSNNTNYEYRVLACNSYTWACSGYSGSNSVKVRVRPSTPAAANPTTSTDTNSVTVSWPATSGASYYDIQKRNNGGSWVTAATGVTGTSRALSGFANGSWDFRIRACNGYSWSCSSYGADGSSVVWRSVPSTPTAPSAPLTSTGSASVSWTKPSGTVTYYDLQKRNNNGSWVTAKAGDTGTSETVSGLTDGAWDFRVRACNGYSWACSGYSADSADVTVRQIPAATSITKPTSGTNESGDFTVEWNSASDATLYVLQKQTNSGAWSTVQSNSSRTYSVSGLANGTYGYRVKSCNGGTDVCSAYSSTKTVSVSITPDYARKSSAEVPDAPLIKPNVPANEAVGALEGQAGVSGGTATYSVPIVIPPGRAGMQPNVALSYSSRGGNDIAGVGWSIKAASSITRCGKTAAQDDFGFGVTYSATDDRLCLDGQRLMVVSGSYGTSGAEYRFELDSFAKIVQSGNINSASSQFTVYHKNGRKAIYGGENASHIAEGRSEVLTWAISKEEDPAQNTIEYTYSDEGNGEYVLSSIDYTGYASTPGDRNVTFHYKNLARDDQSFAYRQGGLTVKSKLLESITTSYAGTQIREYTLTHAVSNSTERNILQSITECAIDEHGTEACLRPTNLTSYTPNIAWKSIDSGDANQSAIGNFGELEGDDQVLTKDLNGDGIAEALYLDQKEDRTYDVRVYVINSSGDYEHKATADLKGNDIHVYAGIEGDINGDGITDFTTNINNQLVYFQFDPITFELQQHNSGFYFTSGYDRINRGQGVQIVDINGDGYSDLVFGNLGISGDIEAAYYQNKANGDVDFTGPYTLVDMHEGNYNAGGSDESSFLSDVDGDGIQDLVLTYASTPTSMGISVAFGSRNNGRIIATRHAGASLGLPSENAFNQFTWADLNGDGLKDFVRAVEVSSNNFQWAVRINKGNRTFAAEHYLGTNKSIHKHRKRGHLPNEFFDKIQAKFGGLQVGDFDTDGKDELLVATHSDDNYGIRIVGWEHNASGNIEEDMWEACIDNDEIHGTEFYTQSCAGEGHGKEVKSSLSSYDFRRFHWSIIDFSQSGSTISHSRDINNVAYAPLTGFVPLNGQRITQLATKDFNNDGYVDFTYTTASGLSLRSKQEGNVIRFVSVGGYLLDGALAGVFSGSSKPVDGYFAQQNNASLIDQGAGSYARANKEQDILYRVEDGMGKKVEWDFAPISRPELVNGENLYSVPDNRYISSDPKKEHFYFTSSMAVVTNFRQSDGIGGLNENTYRYKEAIFNRMGRGFQGFRTILETNPTGILSVTDFHQQFPIVGQVESQRSCLITDNDESCSTYPLSKNEIGYIDIPSTAYGTHWVIPAKTINKTFELNGRKQLSESLSYVGSVDPGSDLSNLSVSSSNYDDFGNILVQTNKTDTGFGIYHIQTDIDYYTHDQDNWWVDKIKSSTVTTKPLDMSGAINGVYQSILDSETSVTVTNNNYDPKGSRVPSRVTTTASEGKSHIVDKVFNDYGSVTSEKKSSPGETNRVITTTYSSDGYFVNTVTNAVGTASTEISPLHGQSKTNTDVNGLVVYNDYDAFGRAEKATPPGGTGQPTYTRFAWCDSCDGLNNSNVVYKVTTYAAGAPETTEYKDVLGRTLVSRVQKFDGVNVYTNVTYNALGQKTFESVPSESSSSSLGITYHSYDQIGRLTNKSVTQTNGQALDLLYLYGNQDDPTFGPYRTKVSVNNYDRILYRTYDGAGKLMRTTDAVGSVTSYAYNGLGKPSVLQDANNAITTLKYNALGQKKLISDPNMGTKTITFTGFGEVSTETDAIGNVTTYTYDQIGRVKNRQVSGPNETSSATFIFDQENGADDKCKGLLSREYKDDGSEFSKSYHYNNRCQLAEVRTIIDLQDTFSIKTQFDYNYGRPKAIVYPTGITVANEYTQEGYLKRNYNPASDYTYREISAVDEQGNWEIATYANNNASVNRVFNMETGQMRSSQWYSANSLQQELGYSYEAYGNLKQQTANNMWTGVTVRSVEDYIYDDMHRLTNSSLAIDGSQYTNVNYAYDSVGNIRKKSDFSQDSNGAYSYPASNVVRSSSNGWAGPNAVRSVVLSNGATRYYNYDKNGNLVTDGIRTITYNGFNKPTRIQVSSGTINPKLDSQPTASSTADIYYASNQMRYKQVKSINGETTTHLYIDKLFEQVTKKNSSGVTLFKHNKSYLGDIAVVTEKVNSSSVTSFEATYYHRDRLGSMTAEVNELGNVIRGHSFDPFGRPRDENMANKSPLQGLFGYSTNRGFTDHEHLDESQLIHMNGRAYDYNLGRFLSVDPFIQEPGNSQSLNPYSYILNNPMAGTDPSGYLFFLAPVIFKAVSIAVTAYSAYETGKAAAETYQKFENGEISKEDLLVAVGEKAAEEFLMKKARLAEKVLPEAAKQKVKEVAGKVMDKAENLVKGKADNGNSGSMKDNAGDKSEIGSQKSNNKKEEGDGPTCENNSFIAGTLVLTEDGRKPIEKLKVGDKVVSRDENGIDVAVKEVVNTFKEWHEDDTRTIKLKNSKGDVAEIKTTDEHPFYVNDKGWLDAKDLQLQDQVISNQEGELLEVVANDETDIHYYAYNLTVDDYHTYFITEDDAWVHNCQKKSPGQLGREGEEKASAITGTDKNTTKYEVNGRKRIPDQVNSADKVDPDHVTEVKNVKSQSYTQQLKDDVALVGGEGGGGKVDVFVRGNTSEVGPQIPTKISKPLQDAHDNPDNPINIRAEL